MLSPRELREIERANDSGRTPVVFVHGLWLLASSWDRWRRLFEDAGYVTVAAAWPDDPDTVTEARNHPQRFANKHIGEVVSHLADVIGELRLHPAVVGHSFGGLFAQILAGGGLSAATVAIDPAPFRGVLPLPFSALRSGLPVLGNPANRRRAVMLRYPEFRYAWANTVDEQQARMLYDTYLVPGSGAPLFQAAFANLNPSTEARVDTLAENRGPMLLIAGLKDHTVPPAMVEAAYRKQRKNRSITELRRIEDRGHALTIDDRWREVADRALAFVRQHHAPMRPERQTEEAQHVAY